MFKSVFTKYVTVVMLTIIISFIIQISIISSLFGTYSSNSKELSLSRASESVTRQITSEFVDMRYVTFEQYIASYADSIRETVGMMMSYAGDMSIVMTDPSGRVLLTMGGDVPSVTSPASPVYVVDADVMEEVYATPDHAFITSRGGGEDADVEGGVGEVFADVKYVCGARVTRAGETVGAVFTCSDSSNTDSLLGSLINSSILSSLWVMLAALVAVYFISDRVTRPIKNMSVAAKSFAAGDFDARVIVSGNDEVAELAVAFNNMARSLSHNEEMRRTFLANVSHDMRTPMTTISGFVDGILDGTIPKERERHYLEIVSTETKRLSRLVASLLDLTRIESGERKFTLTRFDICEMARQIMISMETRIEEERLGVEFNCSSDNIYVRSDHDAVYQALYNLCDNAVKFSREGGRLRVGIAVRAKKAYVSVYNEGRGIAESELPLIFDRFYKSDKSRGLDKTGVGLGLYITKTVLDALGESIEVKSEQGKYCEFTFTVGLDL